MEFDSIYQGPEDDPLSEYARQIEEVLRNDLPLLLSNELGKSVYFKYIKDQVGLDNAIYCLSQMQKFDRYRDERLGQIDPSAGLAKGVFKSGQVILFSDVENGKATVDTPYSPKAIESSLAKHSLIFTHTMINVPAAIIQPIITRSSK